MLVSFSLAWEHRRIMSYEFEPQGHEGFEI